jgi:transposase-like protein
MANVPDPKTLQEAVKIFADEDNCIAYMVAKRWPNGVTCPTCGSEKVGFLANQRRWQCSTKHPKRQFSAKVGTIFEDSPLGLDKWLPVVWLITNAKNGISSWEVHRAMGVTQKTAWFMLHRVRLAMQDEKSGGKLGGEVEVDETFIGGKARNMHSERRKRALEGRTAGKHGKVGIQGMLQRGGKVVAEVIDNTRYETVVPNVHANIDEGSTVYTDEATHYFSLQGWFDHQVVNHAETYVNGNVHTNGIENFWSCLKRTIGGTYVSVEPFHLFRYVDEQAFRYDNRKPMDDSERFSYVMRKIVGKRIMYKELTGKTEAQSEAQTEEF